LTRFDIYAGRVRVLNEASAEIPLTPFACTYLSTRRRPLVPGLREIRTGGERFEHDWAAFLLLCSANLKFVDLLTVGDEDGQKMGAFLQSLHAVAGDETHGLEVLQISAHHTHVDLITKFNLLQDIALWFNSRTTGAMVVGGFSKLSALHHLSRLHLTWNVQEDENHSHFSSLLPPHSVDFPSLHSIEIRAPSYIVLLLVQCLRAYNLKCIELTCLSPPRDQSTTFRQLIEACGLLVASLEEVGFDFHGDERIDREAIGSIFNLTRRFHLRTLVLKGPEFDIDNAYINEACQFHYFSHLEVLRLTTYQYCQFNSLLTFPILRSFAIHCPLLKDLELCLTVEEEHLLLLIEETENKHSLSHCLKTLTINLTKTAETTTFLTNRESIPVVSMYLDSLFPSLDFRTNDVWIYQYDPFVRGIRRILRGLQHRSVMDSRRLVGSQVTDI